MLSRKTRWIPSGRSSGGFGVLWVCFWPELAFLAAFWVRMAHSGAKRVKMSLNGGNTLQLVPFYIKQARFRRMWWLFHRKMEEIVRFVSKMAQTGSLCVESHINYTNTCVKHKCHDFFHRHDKMSYKRDFDRKVRWSRDGRVTVAAVAVVAA